MSVHPLVLLAGAITFEIVATLSLRASSGFSRIGPSVVVLVGYIACYVLLGFALKAGLDLGAGYAIWSGVGTAVVAIASVLLFQERLTPIGVAGIGLIVVGVVALHLGGTHTGSDGDVPRSAGPATGADA